MSLLILLYSKCKNESRGEQTHWLQIFRFTIVAEGGSQAEKTKRNPYVTVNRTAWGQLIHCDNSMIRIGLWDYKNKMPLITDLLYCMVHLTNYWHLSANQVIFLSITNIMIDNSRIYPKYIETGRWPECPLRMHFLSVSAPCLVFACCRLVSLTSEDIFIPLTEALS